jgi:hypothetical protein
MPITTICVATSGEFSREASTKGVTTRWTRIVSPVRPRRPRAVKETAGKALGDAKLTAEGKSDKAEGKVQNAIGGLKDALKK